MIGRMIDNYNEDIDNELENYLSNLSLQEIISLYIKFSNPVYLSNKKNMFKSLNLMYANVAKKMNSVSLFNLIDLYTNIYLEILYFEDSIEGLKNIINARNGNLEDDFIVEYEAKRQNISKDEFIKRYTESINKISVNLINLNETFKYLDSLQKGIQSYINNEIDNLSIEESKLLFKQINDKIEENSQEILKRNDLRRNKKAADIQARILETPTFDIFNLFDTTSLKNELNIYKKYQVIIYDKISNINKNKG